jgi:hypothetical protein
MLFGMLMFCFSIVMATAVPLSYAAFAKAGAPACLFFPKSGSKNGLILRKNKQADYFLKLKNTKKTAALNSKNLNNKHLQKNKALIIIQ